MTLSSFLLTVRKRRGQRSPLLTAYTCACVSGHGRCSQRCEGLQRHPEGTEESRSRGKGQRGSNFEGLDFYMISLCINVYMQRDCVYYLCLYPIGRYMYNLVGARVVLL